MQDYRFLIIIFAMAIVSYMPRVVPALFISKVKMNPFVKRFLDMIPYTAMTALVFPGIFYSVPNNSLAAIVGTICAIVFSFIRVPLSLVVVLSVIAVLVVQTFN